MKQSLQLKISQNLALTPQLQQAIRLLQLSSLELQEEVERALQENPFLERVEAISEGSWAAPSDEGVQNHQEAPATAEVAPSDSEWSSAEEAQTNNSQEESGLRELQEWGAQGTYRDGDDDDGEMSPELRLTAPVSLQEHLHWQLQLSQLSERDRWIIEVLIDAVDENGYLTTPLAELQAVLPAELEVTLEEMQIGAAYLKSFDPIGVGARDVTECLLLQIEALPTTTPYRQEATHLVKEYLALLAHRDYPKLKRLLRCSDVALKGAEDLIHKLNPKPGARYSTSEAKYVVADLIVRRQKGEWKAELNEAVVPQLRLNQLYSGILSRHRDSSLQQLRGHLQEAKWMIKNIHQRYETILRVGEAIVQRQRAFFDHGEVAMRPLVLQEIADQLELHESTISRVTSQKYMLTPRGIFELKYFFGSHVATETGGAASATAIRALIKQVISQENRQKPISDSKIAELLKEQGLIVARRTVAKYRETLQIPPAHLRKSL